MDVFLLINKRGDMIVKIAKIFELKKLLLLAVSLFLYGPVIADTDTQSVNWFSDGSPSGGWSHLTRTGGMIVVTVEAAQLVSGDAHTLWWIVFNTPSGCSAPGCGENDIFLPTGDLNVDGVLAAGIAIGNATGNIAKADGTLEFGGRLVRGGGAAGHQVLFTPADFGGDGGGSVLYAGAEDDAEVHLILQSHGEARGGPKLLEQLSYVDSNCTPTCEDRQFTVHLAPAP
jgi:hypothetical protein